MFIALTGDSHRRWGREVDNNNADDNDSNHFDSVGGDVPLLISKCSCVFRACCLKGAITYPFICACGQKCLFCACVQWCGCFSI